MLTQHIDVYFQKMLLVEYFIRLFVINSIFSFNSELKLYLKIVHLKSFENKIYLRSEFVTILSFSDQSPTQVQCALGNVFMMLWSLPPFLQR